MIGKEIEFKYSAVDLTLTKVSELCKARGCIRVSSVSGYDHFYGNSTKEGTFYRYRINDCINQLTYKKKTEVSNSFNRIEHNIDLAVSMDRPTVEAYLFEFGYLYNTSIFKNAVIFLFDYYVVSYYICYDLDMVEVGRFLEIEVREDHNWRSESEAWSALLTLEKVYKGLGVSPDKRLRQSLYEMYKE